ncbi:hypothetical protein TNCV_1479951 [Trichonephila clavipes]|nr:hypothetical protein TNCV_1479951 [Trichonephila clavipes]
MHWIAKVKKSFSRPPGEAVDTTRDLCDRLVRPISGRVLLVSLETSLAGNFTELNRTVTCMVLKAKANDRRTSSPLPRGICDETHFWWNGYVNKQNCRIWSEANPQVYVETPLHPEKLTVWCALWAGGILLQKR